MKSRLVQWFVISLVASVALPAAAQTSGTFATTGSMNIARFSATATLLPNGQVLVAGGNNNGPLSSAELYNPATGTWTKTGNMKTARWGDSMTLLQNGQVLVAGGEDSTGAALASAELYNPATGTWAKTGNMTTPRADPRAVLLQTGMVFVAGGITSSGSLFSAELYDPATGKWKETGSMPNTAGEGLTATVLQSGKVLVFEGASSTSSLYDPASGQWAAIGFTAGKRNDAVATLLGNGKVMFTGGLVYSPRPTHTVAWATLYDPLTGAAEGNGPLLISRYGHTATLLQNGQVLVAGGNEINSPSSAGLSEAELYTP